MNKEIDIFDFLNLWEKTRFPKHWYLFRNRDDSRKTGEGFIKAIKKSKEKDIELMALLEQFCHDFEKYKRIKHLTEKVEERRVNIKDTKDNLTRNPKVEKYH